MKQPLATRSLDWRRAGYLLLLAACVAVAIPAIKMLLAEINAYQTSLFVVDWAEKGEQPADKAWNIAHSGALRAVQLSPAANGRYYDRLGRVYEWRYPRALPGGELGEESRRQALQAYRQAVQYRPDWVYTWNRIAWVKAQLLEFDEEFDEALKRSVESGHWRWRSNASVTKTGLFAWAEMTPQQKLLTASALRRLEAVNSREYRDIVAYAEKRNLAAELAALAPKP